jgi:hypothetical protein
LSSIDFQHHNRMFTNNSHLYRPNYSKLHELMPEKKDDWIEEIIDRYLNNGKYAPIEIEF